MTHKVINGYYSDNNDINLVVLNDKGKFIKKIKGVKPYFYVRKEDYDKEHIRNYFTDNEFISKIIPDGINPKFKIIYLRKYKDIYEVRERLKNMNIELYEADVPFVRRVMIDKKMGVGTKKMRKLYIDIETDDSKHGIVIGRDRILSIGCEDENKKKWFITDPNEKEILKQFKEILKDYDLLVAWYGERFDFPYIEDRCRVNRVWIDWRLYQKSDFYKVFRATRRAGIPELHGGYGLDNVGDKELGLKKIERTMKVITMYNTDLKLLEKYNMRDVEIMVKLEEKLMLIAQQEMLAETAGVFISNISGTTVLDTLILRKVADDSLHYRFKCKGWFNKGEFIKDGSGYKGAYVFTPIPGLHENVLVFDFKSLYDSIARTFNICFTTVDEGKEITTPANLCTFTNKKEGLLPQMMGVLAKKVNGLKQKILDKEAEGDDRGSAIYKLRMWSLKNILKSFYGQMGSKYSRFYDSRLAESITQTGQWLIKKTSEEITKMGYLVIAGDTDSIFIKFKNVDDVVKEGLRVNEHLNKCYKKWMESYNPYKNYIHMKFEKVFKQIIIVGEENNPRKKRYACHQVWDEGNVIDKIKYVGLEAVRSDWGIMAREWQKEIVNRIFKGDDLKSFIKSVEEKRDWVADLKLTKENLTLYKKINKPTDKYGKENGKGKPVHVRVAETMITKGIDVWSGLTIPYIIIGREDNKLKGIYAEDYNGEYDEEYYWNKQLYPPVYRVLQTVFTKYNWDLLMLNPKIGKFKQTRDQKSLMDFG